MSEPTSLDELLAHEGFLRALVRGLVHGEAEVDDVLQETFSIALRRGPREPRALRGWLARVARNVAFTTRRAEARRTRREAASARPDRVPSPLEILEREATRRRLVHTVLALDPLYRDPIVLRWLEGLPVPEVAARLGVSVDTAKTRLRRGLERIRERLDEREGGGRRAWMLALAPLAGAFPAPHVATPAPGVSSAGALARHLLTPRALAFVTAAGLAAGTALVAWRADPHRDAPEGAAVGASAAGVAGLATAPTTPGARGADPSGARPPTPGADAPDRSRAFAPGVRPKGVLRGLVVGLDGSTPAAGVALVAEAVAPPTPEALAVPTPVGPALAATTDRDGRFELGDVPAGAWRVRAQGADGAAAEAIVSVSLEAGAEGAGSAPWARLALAPPAAPAAPAPLRVRVSGPDGRPVAGARVVLTGDEAGPPRAATSDATGLADLPAELAGGATLEASHEGRVAWRRIADLRTARLEPQPWALGLDVPARLAGTVRDGAGAPAAGVEVQAWRWVMLWDGPPVRSMRTATTTDAQGAYVIDGLAAGMHVLLVRGGDATLADAPGRRDGGLRWVSVRSGADLSLDLRVARGGAISGQALDETGAPLLGARVEVSLPYGAPYGPSAETQEGTPVWSLGSPWPASADHPYGRRTAVTDADGRYRIDGLPASAAWRLVVSAPDRAFDARADLAVEAGATVALSHRLEPAGVLEALVPPGATALVRREGEDRPLAALSLPPDGGALRLPGLAPGGYALALRSWRPDGSTAPIAFEVRAGATTFIDASARVVGRTRLTFRRGGLPLPGTCVLGALSVRYADAEGRVGIPGGAGAGVPVVHGVRAPERDATRLVITWPAPEWETTAFDRTLDLPDGRLRVRVLDGEGRPVAGAAVRLAGSHLALGGDAEASVDERRLADGEGVVSFSGLPSGTYDLAAVGPSLGARATRTVTVPDDDADVALVLKAP